MFEVGQPNTLSVADEQYDLFEPKMGKPKADTAVGATRSVRRAVSFRRQVMQAVAKAGGDPRRMGKPRTKRADGEARTGRFSARGRGAKIVKTVPTDNSWKLDASSGQRIAGWWSKATS